MTNETKASKRNKGILALVSMLLLTLVLTGAGGYTLARYTTQEKGVGRAKFASWSFQIAKNGAETKVVDLASTVDKDTLVNGKIAPGTSGSFSITLDASGSEMGVDYLLAFINEENKPANLVFSYNDRKGKSLGEIGDITGTIAKDGKKQVTMNITWSWPYQTGSTQDEKDKNDAIDTQTGISPLDYTFEILAIGTQSKV